MKCCFVDPVGPDGFIRVDPIIQELLGFQEHSMTFFFLVRSEYTKVKGQNLVGYKVVISPLDPETWLELYDLEFRLGDDPGSFARIAEFLMEQGISIQLGESRTRLWNVRAELSIVAWFKNFEGTVADLNQLLEQLMLGDETLKMRDFIKPVDVRGDTEIWVTGEPSPLQRVSLSRQYAPGKAGIHGKDMPIPIPANERFGLVREGGIVLPRSVVETVDDHFRLPSRHYRSIAGDGYAIVNADTDTKLLTLTFPDPGVRVIEVEFHLADDIGEVAKVARVLSNTSHLNLLEARHYTLVFADHATWRVIADMRNSNLRGMSIEEVEAEINTLLEDAGVNLRRDVLAGQAVKVVKAIGGREEPEYYAHTLMRSLERELRHFITNRLRAAAGDIWWRDRVPPDVRERAEERRTTESAQRSIAGEDGSELVEYVDFADYVRILLRKNNWADAFSAFFPNKEWIATRLQELEPVRNRIAHTRDLSRTDLTRLELFAEDIKRALVTSDPASSLAVEHDESHP
jgi:hypothetical protein